MSKVDTSDQPSLFDNQFIIELYWEPTIPECGVWDRSDAYSGVYTDDESDQILRKHPDLAYRKTRVAGR